MTGDTDADPPLEVWVPDTSVPHPDEPAGSNAVGLRVTHVGEWEHRALPSCPQTRGEPDGCGCGHVGRWETRWLLAPSVSDIEYVRLPSGRRYARRSPAPAERHLVVVGQDERCPGCGDIERFRLADYAYAGARAEFATVLLGSRHRTDAD